MGAPEHRMPAARAALLGARHDDVSVERHPWFRADGGHDDLLEWAERTEEGGR